MSLQHRYLSPFSAPVGMRPVDEREWIARIQMGDAAAFEAMFRTYFQPLYAFAMGYVKEHAVAEEVAQDVLCHVWEHRTTWYVQTTLRAYLYAATRNRAISHLRRTRVERKVEESSDPQSMTIGMSQPIKAADMELEFDEKIAAVREAVTMLTERRRLTIALRWEYGMTYAEIAQVLGISIRAAETTHLRALNDLRKQLAGLL